MSKKPLLVLLIAALAGAALIVARDQGGVNPASPGEITWETSLPQALEASKQSGKPIFVDFYATWCGPCKMLDKETYPHPDVVAESRNWTMVKVDTDKEQEISRKYGVSNLPTLVAMDSAGKPILGTVGFLDSKTMLRFLHESKVKLAKSSP